MNVGEHVRIAGHYNTGVIKEVREQDCLIEVAGKVLNFLKTEFKVIAAPLQDDFSKLVRWDALTRS